MEGQRDIYFKRYSPDVNPDQYNHSDAYTDPHPVSLSDSDQYEDQNSQSNSNAVIPFISSGGSWQGF